MLVHPWSQVSRRGVLAGAQDLPDRSPFGTPGGTMPALEMWEGQAGDKFMTTLLTQALS